MKKNIILFILGFIFLYVLKFVFTYEELFYLMVVSCLYFIFVIGFSNIKCDKKKNFTSVFLLIIVFSLIYFILSSFIGYLFFPRIKLLLMVMGLSVCIIPCLNLFKSFISKKKNRIINCLFYGVIFVSIVLSIVLYLLLKIDINVVGIIVCLSGYFVLIPVIWFNRSILDFKNVNFKVVLPLFSYDLKNIFVKLSNIFYFYLSLIFLYFSLTRLYLYYDKTVTRVLVEVYLYYYYIVVFLSFLLFSSAKEKDVNVLFINIIKKILPILILLSMLSGSLLFVVFGNYQYSYIFSLLIFEVLFIVMYNVAISMIKDKSNFYVVLIIGILLKCILTIPLINSFYRMGYSMIYGDIVSTIISMFIVVLTVIIYFNKIQKHEFSKYFGNLLNVIYENVILCLILILLQFLVPLFPRNYFYAVGCIIIYSVVFLIFYRIKDAIKVKK